MPTKLILVPSTVRILALAVGRLLAKKFEQTQLQNIPGVIYVNGRG